MNHRSFENDTEPALFGIYKGTVSGMKDFGAFVSLDQFSGRGKRVEGMVHVSMLSGGGRRIDHPEDLVKRGQTVFVVSVFFFLPLLIMMCVESNVDQWIENRTIAQGC